MEQEPDHISSTRARGGTTPHMTRYVLLWGVGLVVVIFAMDEGGQVTLVAPAAEPALEAQA